MIDEIKKRLAEKGVFERYNLLFEVIGEEQIKVRQSGVLSLSGNFYAVDIPLIVEDLAWAYYAVENNEVVLIIKSK